MMNNVYDNWERLVRATRKREEFWELARANSRESSLSSFSSEFSSRFSFNSPVPHHFQGPEASSSTSVPLFSGDSTGENLPIPRSEYGLSQLPDVMLISSNELENAILSDDRSKGMGEIVYVYHGWLNTHITLDAEKLGWGKGQKAISIMYIDMPGFEEWLKVRLLHHPNLIKLIAYSNKDDTKLLAYEPVPNRSLDNHLFTRYQPLSWATRLKVAIGAARGLSFLHNVKNNVIHGNFKSSTLLLDEEFNAKLCDFGCAKYKVKYESPVGDLYVTRWEMDYAAREYINRGVYTKKYDVYAFGVVLLELLFRRRASEEGEFLVDWAKTYLSDERRIYQVVDTRLEGRYSRKGASSVAALALQCVSDLPHKRPDMAEVLSALERVQDMSYRQIMSNSVNDEGKLSSSRAVKIMVD